MFSLLAYLVDARHAELVRPARIYFEHGRITAIEPADAKPQVYLVPGLVDAHVHIESSMLPPAEFGRWAAAQGTLATVSDPHEIANVLGLEGVRYMLDQAAHSPIYHHLGAPSCVPATDAETAGALLTVADTQTMLADWGMPYLSEMMNWPGVLYKDETVMAKIALAQALGKPIDGHAPGLRGAQAAIYAQAGISTDHECVAADEAREKLAAGMKILIRQGSAARNLEALHPLVAEAPGRIMLCTDDCHPDTLLHGHINRLVEQLLALGHDLADILEASHYAPKAHYGLPLGSLQVGDTADFVVLPSLQDWSPLAVYRQGVLIAEQGKPLEAYRQAPAPNRFAAIPLHAADFILPTYQDASRYPVIVAEDGQLITQVAYQDTLLGPPAPDLDTDTLLLAVVNRYHAGAKPATALIRGFGLKEGAAASSVAHDSHNIVAVGTSASAVAAAVNAVIGTQGGLALVDGQGQATTLPLPIAGLMSDQPGPEVSARYQALEAQARAQGASPKATFMLLSFMALLVIPKLKLSDMGLFDGEQFTFYA